LGIVGAIGDCEFGIWDIWDWGFVREGWFFFLHLAEDFGEGLAGEGRVAGEEFVEATWSVLSTTKTRRARSRASARPLRVLRAFVVVTC
jgi:hypothetical protein